MGLKLWTLFKKKKFLMKTLYRGGEVKNYVFFADVIYERALYIVNIWLQNVNFEFLMSNIYKWKSQRKMQFGKKISFRGLMSFFPIKRQKKFHLVFLNFSLISKGFKFFTIGFTKYDSIKIKIQYLNTLIKGYVIHKTTLHPLNCSFVANTQTKSSLMRSEIEI